MHEVEVIILKDVQTELCDYHGVKESIEKSSVQRQYRRLNPVKDHRGLWVVGGRMTLSFPDGHLPVLLPTKHKYTGLLMREAHVASCHRGRDATLARFRIGYWTPQGSKLARSRNSIVRLAS